MKRILALILTAAMLVSMFAVITTAANSYEFTINGIDVPVESGGVVVCTSLESWANCNPNWSNNLQLTPNGDSYKVIAASSCPGESLSSVTADALIEASGFTANDGDIYVILHGEGNANAYSVGVGMTVTIDNLEAGGIITFSDTVSSDDNTGDDNTDGDNTDDTGATEDEVAPDEPVEPETPTDTKAIEVENNVAAGKSYTTSLPFRMGSADINWAYDETAEITFPDTDGIELTDGLLAADCDYRNSAWVGLHDNTPDAVAAGYSWVTVDLAGEYNVTEIRVYMPSSAPAFAQYGIAPSYVTFVGYDNNGIAVELGDGSLMDSDSETFAYSSMVCDIALTKVEVRMIRGCGWTFVSEIVIVGTETTSDDNVGDDNTGGDDMDAPTEGNLALGKDYVSDAPIVNPENSVDYSANLTDGVVATEFGFDGSWFMFNNGVNTTDSKGIVVVELVDLVDITQLKVHLCEKLDFGVAAPSEITAWGSKDGCNYTKMGSLSIPADRTDGIGCWATLDVTDAWYRFVKFNIELNGNYALVNEVEVYGTYHECSPCLADEWDSDVENHWHECECGEKIDIAAHIEGEWVTVLEPEIGKEGKEEL